MKIKEKVNTVKPIFVFVGGLKKKQWIRENELSGNDRSRFHCIMVLWVMMPCYLVDRCHIFRGTCCCHLQGRRLVGSSVTLVPIYWTVTSQTLTGRLGDTCG
jgi:hypothetical protein